MKFSSSTILFGLCILVASCSAACNCSSSDQPCMDKCVLAANSCIVKCKDGGDACQKACISSHWPASPISQKDVLGDVSSTIMSSVTRSDSSVPTGSHSESMHVSTYSTTSGGSAVLVTTTMRPSSTNPRSPTSTATRTDGTPASSSGSRQMVPMVTMAGVMVMLACIM